MWQKFVIYLYLSKPISELFLDIATQEMNRMTLKAVVSRSAPRTFCVRGRTLQPIQLIAWQSWIFWSSGKIE